MDILDDMGVSQLSAKVFFKVNSFKSATCSQENVALTLSYCNIVYVLNCSHTMHTVQC